MRVTAGALALLLCVGLPGGPLFFPAYASRLNDYSDGNTGPYLNTYNYRGTAEVQIGKTVDLKQYLLYKDSEDERYLQGAITWSTSRNTTASVDKNGIATGLRSGSTTVTAKGHNNVGEVIEQTILLRVKDNRDSITLPKTAHDMTWSLYVGQRANLSQLIPATKITWSVRNEKIASVAKDGTVVGEAIGKTEITAAYKDENGEEQSILIELKVSGNMEYNNHRTNTLTLHKGETVNLLEMYYPSLTTVSQTSMGEWLQLSSSDIKVADVGSYIITAKSTGSCKVTLEYDEFTREGYRGNEIFKIRVVD